MGRNYNYAKSRKKKEKANTKKIVNKLLRAQTSAKRNFRLKAKMKRNKVLTAPEEDREQLKFGSINIDGIDIQKHWAITELIKSRGFDVGFFFT